MSNRLAKSLLGGVFFSCSLFGNSTFVEEEVECGQDYVLADSIFLTFQNVDGGGLGYERGYASLKGTFFLVGEKNCVTPFLDLRFHKFKVNNSPCKPCCCNNDWAANVGVGLRYNPDCSPNIFGLNFYYDYQANKCNFDQLGLGLEWINPCFDFSLNLYHPFKDQKLAKRCVFDDYVGDFFIIQDKIKMAFSSWDMAVGHSFCYNDCLDFYGSLGVYYIRGKFCKGPRDFYGPRLRLKASICDYFSLEGIFTYDSHFRLRAQGLFSFTIPLGGCCVPCESYNPCIYNPVYRNEILILDQFCKWKRNF